MILLRVCVKRQRCDDVKRIKKIPKKDHKIRNSRKKTAKKPKKTKAQQKTLLKTTQEIELQQKVLPSRKRHRITELDWKKNLSYKRKILSDKKTFKKSTKQKTLHNTTD